MAQARIRIARVVLGVVAAGLGGAAHAQGDSAPLAGPTVEVREVPGVEARYVAGDTRTMAGPEAAVPLPVFFEALRALGDEEAPPALRLTDEQRDRIGEEVRAFGREVAAFVETSGDEARALIATLPQGERGGAAGELRAVEQLTRTLDRFERGGGMGTTLGPGARRPDRPAPLAGKQRRDELVRGFRLRVNPEPTDARADGATASTDGGPIDAGARLAELRAGAPSVAGVQTRVWTLLTDAQRRHLRPKLEAAMAETRAKREEARLARTIEQRRAAQPDAAPGARAPSDRPSAARTIDAGDGAIDRLLVQLDAGQIPERLWARLPDRVRQRIESLPEGERAAAVARLVRSRQNPGE
jgi:hypothetical protein